MRSLLRILSSGLILNYSSFIMHNKCPGTGLQEHKMNISIWLTDRCFAVDTAIPITTGADISVVGNTGTGSSIVAWEVVARIYVNLSSYEETGNNDKIQ